MPPASLLERYKTLGRSAQLYLSKKFWEGATGLQFEKPEDVQMTSNTYKHPLNVGQMIVAI